MNFSRVNLHVKSERMPELVDAARAPGDAIFDRFAHGSNFTVEKIDVIALDLEPSATVHSGAPLAERSHQAVCMAIVEVLRSRSQSCRRERLRAVVIDTSPVTAPVLEFPQPFRRC